MPISLVYYYMGVFCDIWTLLFIIDSCLGNILESTKGIGMKLGL